MKERAWYPEVSYYVHYDLSSRYTSQQGRFYHGLSANSIYTTICRSKCQASDTAHRRINLYQDPKWIQAFGAYTDNIQGIKQRVAMTGGPSSADSARILLPSHRMLMRGILHQEHDWKGTAKIESMSK